MNRIPSLDGFRAISIILVLIYHSSFSIGFPQKYAPIVAGGKEGVTIFFVISGFLITYLLLNEKSKYGTINLKSFYIKRAIRILPAFFLYCIFIVLVWPAFESYRFHENELWHLFTFTENYTFKSWFIGHFWSLSVEEQFYLFWPALLLIFNKHLKTILFILIAYSWIVRAFIYKYPMSVSVSIWPFFNYSDSIFIGSLGAIYYFNTPTLVSNKIFKSYLLQGLALLLIISFKYFSSVGKFGKISLPFGNTIISASILYLILSYVTPSKSLIYKFLNCKPMVHLGILSYSMYIWQQFFIVGSLKVFWRTLPYNMIFAYIVSLLAYNLWEKQFLKLKKYVKN